VVTGRQAGRQAGRDVNVYLRPPPPPPKAHAPRARARRADAGRRLRSRGIRGRRELARPALKRRAASYLMSTCMYAHALLDDTPRSAGPAFSGPRGSDIAAGSACVCV
jgi:hypothetical protein